MTEVETATAQTDAAQNQAPMRRRAERWFAAIGLALAAFFQGGFALAVNRSDEVAVRETLIPALRASGVDLVDADALETLNTLAAWFGFALIVMALLCAIGFFIAARRPSRRSTGWWFAGAGAVCLIGTQLALYPIAFFFFLAAGLFAVRPSQHRSKT